MLFHGLANIRRLLCQKIRTPWRRRTRLGLWRNLRNDLKGRRRWCLFPRSTGAERRRYEHQTTDDGPAFHVTSLALLLGPTDSSYIESERVADHRVRRVLRLNV